MRENRLRNLWAQGQAAVNGWLAIGNSFSAEVMAHQGWDTLTVDMQHWRHRLRADGHHAASHQHHGDSARGARALA